MVANVWKVVAAAGDEVDRGDTLVILELDEDGDPGAGRVGRHPGPSWPSTRATSSRKAT